jgi:hypothetical protein
MKKRGRPPKGTETMTGAERNRIYRAKKAVGKPKRKAMSGAERQQKLRNARKVAKIRSLVLKETQERDATVGTSSSLPWAARCAAILFEGDNEVLEWNRFIIPHQPPS